MARNYAISIHAPRMGSDRFRGRRKGLALFQSTLPAWGATATFVSPAGEVLKISIHAPRMGSDLNRRLLLTRSCNFNPRSPHGERQIWKRKMPRLMHFNPRSPHGERPPRGYGGEIARYISIHAPRMGSDCTSSGVVLLAIISIHAPRMGSDVIKGNNTGSRKAISIHAPRMGSDVNTAEEESK